MLTYRHIGGLCSFLMISLMMTWGQAPSTHSLPGVHEYVHVDQLPVLINFVEIRQQIGYPLAAVKQEIEGMVFCRVLVDSRGACIAATITRADHPLLKKAVERFLPELRFIPGKVQHQSVACWTNIMVRFDLATAKSFLVKRKAPKVFSGRLFVCRKARKSWRQAVEYKAEGKWEAANRAFEHGFLMYPHRLTPNRKQQAEIWRFLKDWGWIQLHLGETEAALQSLSEAIIWLELLGADAPEQVEELGHLYLLRSEARLAQGFPLDALADCQWVYANSNDHPLKVQALIQMGLVKAHLGDYAGALNMLQQALENAPDNPKGIVYKSRVLLMLGDTESACQTLSTLAEEELSPEWAWKADQTRRQACRPGLFTAQEY